MKRHLQYILILLAAIVIFVPSCKRDGARVIPRSKLAKIYAEMFVTDQWIQSRPSLRTIADTSLVYEPILQKYGYDSDDYQYSIDHYMNDPERFSRILRSTAEILEKEIKVLRKKQADYKSIEEKKKEVANFEITMFQFYHELVSSDGLRGWSDSLDVVWDTVFNAYRFRRIHRTDTIYEGPRMIVNDTLSVSDTLVIDSLVVVDSLAAVDSLVPMETINLPVSQPVKDLSIKELGAKETARLKLDTAMSVTRKGMLRRPEAPIWKIE